MWSFFISVLNFAGTLFLLGHNPVWCGYWYLFKFVVAMSYRFYSWKPQRMHYFMAEFCYFANAILCYYLIQSYRGVASPEMFQLVYALAHGPLGMATITLGDKVVFHNLQYMITVMIHLTPVALTWGYRWNSDVSEALGHSEPFSFSQLLTDVGDHLRLVMPIYAAWFIIYFVVIFIILNKRIEQQENWTMFSYLRGRPNHPIKKILEMNSPTPNLWVKLKYMLIHLGLNTVVVALSAFAWRNFWLDTVYTLMLALSNVFQAASFYDYQDKKTKKALDAANHPSSNDGSDGDSEKPKAE